MSFQNPAPDVSVDKSAQSRRIAIAGNPNAGKSTVFNLLTGMRQRVGNYPGVTVERKSGLLLRHSNVEIVDLPGTYSLNPKSLDEQIAFDALTARLDNEKACDLVVVVVSASNLERNLYLASQVLDLDIPTVIVLNMIDEVERAGRVIDTALLSEILGAPVIPMVATKKVGLDRLLEVLTGPLPAPGRTGWKLQKEVEECTKQLATGLKVIQPNESERRNQSEALRLLVSDRLLDELKDDHPAIYQAFHQARADLQKLEIAFAQAEVSGRYKWLEHVARRVTKTKEEAAARRLTDRLDAILLHRALGPLLFLGILLLVFQAIFTWATPAMDLVEAGMLSLSSLVYRVLPAGMWTDLLVDGVIAGVGNVVIFLPQIVLLFFFLSLMESTGYMARSAFIMDRVMRRFGLSGGSVMPMMSAFACAVPAIMATRTMDNQRDRFITIMVVPLLSCSARLPVYTLFIAAFIPATTIWGPFNYQGVTMLGLYVFGMGTAFFAAWVLARVLKKEKDSFFMLELPPYRAPQWKVIFWRMYERARVFVTRAGKVIFIFSVILWFAATFPQVEPDPTLQASRIAVETELAGLTTDNARQTELSLELEQIANAESAYQMQNSFIGRLGQIIEPVMQPLGFDWRLSAGILAAFAAREVIIGALGTIFSVGEADENSIALRDHLQNATNLETGEPLYTTLVAFSLLVFFVLALQCMSTLAIAKRELNSWKWPIIMWLYMTGLAYIAALIVYQGGKALGWG